MWLNIKTEFTFGQVYGHLDKVAAKCALLGNCGGMTDIGNTFGHIRWRKACKKANIKPIYGVVLPVLEDPGLKERRIPVNNMTFIARTTKGLQEIYNLVDLAHKQFYYKQRISYKQVNDLSEDVFVLSGVAPRWDLIKRTVFQELGLHIPYVNRELTEHPVIACIDNFYIDVEDKIVYEPFADARLKEDKSYSLHIPTKIEWLANFPGREDALINLEKLTAACNVELPNAPMVKYIGTDDVRTWCHRGAGERGISITSDGPYKDRYEREIKLIIDKDYADYFLVVADLIRYAKSKMAVGPARGSSAGSLVCYLMGITEINPLEYDLYFERFIDINRFDLPDIDIDFQDDKRYLVFKYLQKKYGEECVSNIGNISTLKPKSAIDRFAKSLSIPLEDIKELKDSIMERSGGDARANDCIEDSINDTDVGKRFIEKYPAMKVVSKIEAHASHTGVHAAGILVCNDPITKYAGVNSRDKDKDSKRIAMLDKKDAEAINLLKIDALGLRTLAILAGVCDQIGKPYGWLYDIPVDDELTYKVFNDHRFNGIFQFEGPAIKGLAKQMPIDNMEDISALSALGRPGPLNSGGANRYIKFRSGRDVPVYLSNHPIIIKATENTFGIVVYQEQMLQISREYGKLSWKDTGDLRKAASKSLGDEFFGKFKDKFLEGALSLGETEQDATKVWDGICTMGSWCLSGETRIKLASAGNNLKSGVTIAELYERYVVNRSPYIRQMGSMPTLVSLEENKGRCFPQKVDSIIYSGKKYCNKYIFDDKSFVDCTPEHQFLIDGNWRQVKDAKIGSKFASSEYSGTGYKKIGSKSKGKHYESNKGFRTGEENPSYINGKTNAIESFREKMKDENCQNCYNEHDRMEIHHQDFDNGLIFPDRLQWLCPSCHKSIHYASGRNKRWSVGHKIVFKTLIEIEEIGEIDTYDIGMATHHNFALYNGLITHNSFNKSHSVSYGLISYLCTHMKAHYPLEFTVSCLNHAKEDSSALKILRDAVEHDGIQYKHIDKDLSTQKWSVQDGLLIGGLSTIHGIGPAGANKIVKFRNTNETLPKGIRDKLEFGVSNFKYLYPGKQLYGDYYKDPQSHGLDGIITHINDTDKNGMFTIIGCMIKKNLRDANEACFVTKRKGVYETGLTAWLNLTLEDDTDSLMCKIPKDKYERLGRIIAETGKTDKDWYMVHGEKINGWSLLFVKNIMRITREI